jgi:hypothetical protein
VVENTGDGLGRDPGGALADKVDAAHPVFRQGLHDVLGEGAFRQGDGVLVGDVRGDLPAVLQGPGHGKGGFGHLLEKIVGKVLAVDVPGGDPGVLDALRP